MVFRRNRLLRYVFSIFVLILITQSIQNIIYDDYTYDPEIHQFVPDALRHTVRKSSSFYTINDLLNLTKSSENYQLSSSENSVHLITQWYYEENHRRRQELISVLHMNVINDAITKIHFIQNSNHCTIFDDIRVDQQFPYDLLKSKLILFYYQNSTDHQRLTIHQALRYANHFIKTGYTILVNLDGFFDRSLSLLKYQSLLDEKTILYLSRYEVDLSISTLGIQCSDEHYVGSHDALIFRTPFPNDFIEQLPFEIGTWNIEVKIIYELMKKNYTVRNTCKSIRLWHLHSSQIRHQLMPNKKYIPNKNLHLIMRKPEFL